MHSIGLWDNIKLSAKEIKYENVKWIGPAKYGTVRGGGSILWRFCNRKFNNGLENIRNDDSLWHQLFQGMYLHSLLLICLILWSWK